MRRSRRKRVAGSGCVAEETCTKTPAARDREVTTCIRLCLARGSPQHRGTASRMRHPVAPPPPPPSTGTLRPRRIPCLSRLEFLGSSPESANAGKRKLLLTSTAMRRSDKLPCTNLGKAGVVNEGQLSEHSVCPITDTFSRSFRSVFSESVELLETVSLPRENGERVGLRATMSRRYRPGFKCNQLLLYETSRKIA